MKATSLSSLGSLSRGIVPGYLVWINASLGKGRMKSGELPP